MARILIIDDVASIRAFLEIALTKAGHSVRAEADGRKGLEALRQETFDLLITDLYMPESDGLEMLRIARAEGLMPPTIAISSQDTIMDLTPIARHMGAAAALIKPIDGRQLLETVDRVLAATPCPPEYGGRGRTPRPD